MNTTTSANIFVGPVPRHYSAKERFRERFQRSLRSCVGRGFSIEEAFGMIWVETWEEVALSEEEQSELYEELLTWVKTGLFNRKRGVVHRSYSPQAARF